METTITLLLPLLFLPLITLWFFLISKYNSKEKKRHRPPPGPPAIPFIGGLLSLAGDVYDLITTLHRLKLDYGSIVTFNLGIFPAIFVFDGRLTYEALVQKGGIFSNRKPPHPNGATAIHASNGHTIGTGNGAVWRLLRRNLASSMLHPSNVGAFSKVRRYALRCLEEDLLLQSNSGEGVILVSKVLRRAMFDVLIKMCFGEDVDERKMREVERIQHDLLLMSWKLNVFDIFPISKIFLWRRWRSFVQTRREQEAIMLPLIASRRRAKGTLPDPPCYVDTLLELQLPVDGRRALHDDEIVSMCSEFLNAGTDTTTTTLEWIMAEIVRHPHIQERLVEEIETFAPPGEQIDEASLKNMPFLEAVVLEGLRRHPPAAFLLPHVLLEDAVLDGYDISEGSTINFAIAEMGWDANEWEKPLEFHPERFLGKKVDITGGKELKMIPFGTGRRICPGLGLAMLHLQYFLAALVRDFAWKVADGEEVDLSETVEFTLVMKNRLRVQIRPRDIATNA